MERDVKNWLISQLPVNLVVQTQCKHLTKICLHNFQHGLSFREKLGTANSYNGLMPIILQINYDTMLLLRWLSYVLNQ